MSESGPVAAGAPAPGRPAAPGPGPAADGPLRDRLVSAGVAILDRDGPAELSLRAITRAVGVSHGAPRRYFPTHNSLLAAIAATGLADLADLLAPHWSAPEPAAERLGRIARAYVDFARRRPAMFELIFRHDLLDGAGARLRETSLPLFDGVFGLVREARPPSDGADDARTRALALWANVHGLAVLAARGGLGLVAPDADPAALLAPIVATHLR